MKIIFACKKKDVDNGVFSIKDLKTFSANTGATIIIKKLGIITDGVLNYTH